MRILAIEYYPTSIRGGSEKAYFEILTSLRQNGHKVILAYCVHGDLIDRYEMAGISCIQIKRTNIQNYFSLSEWLEFGSSYNKVKDMFDVIYLNYINDTPLGLICKFLRRKKMICHIRVPNLSNCRQFRFTGKYVDQFIFLSQKQYLTYKVHYPLNNYTIISDGLKTELLPTSSGPKRWSAVYLGRISPQKGLIDLIEAWKILRDQYFLSIPLAITGPAFSTDEKEYCKNISEKISTFNLENLVTVCPPVCNPVAYLQRFSFSVFPSVVEETFGRSLVESVLAGRPVFARNIGVADEILEPEKEKLVFTDTEDLALKIYQYVTGRFSVQIEMLQNHVQRKYGLDDKVDLIEKVLLDGLKTKEFAACENSNY